MKGVVFGILLLAHGGRPEWNAEVKKIAAELDKTAPTEAAIGMADPGAMQKAIDALEARKVEKIVAVPLFINSASEVMDQTRFVLGIAEKPSAVLKEGMERMMRDPAMAAHVIGRHTMTFDRRVSVKVPVVLTPALDAAPEVAGILLARAKALSKDPSKETVVLVGHGPVDEADNVEWLATMKELGAAVRKAGGFKAVKKATLRDDSAPEVKARAAGILRDIVARGADGGGRAIVIPYLIARGGIETHVAEALKGLDYAWDGRTLCPDPAIARWAAAVAMRGANKDNMRRFGH